MNFCSRAEVRRKILNQVFSFYGDVLEFYIDPKSPPKTSLHFASPVSRSTSESFPGRWLNDGRNAKFFHPHYLLPHNMHKYICIFPGWSIGLSSVKAVRLTDFRPKKMKSSLFLLIFERRNAEISLNNFQPMVVFRFWRNWEFTFFQTSLQPLALYFARSPLPTQSSRPFCPGAQFSCDSMRAFNDDGAGGSRGRPGGGRE